MLALAVVAVEEFVVAKVGEQVVQKQEHEFSSTLLVKGLVGWLERNHNEIEDAGSVPQTRIEDAKLRLGVWKSIVEVE